MVVVRSGAAVAAALSLIRPSRPLARPAGAQRSSIISVRLRADVLRRRRHRLGADRDAGHQSEAENEGFEIGRHGHSAFSCDLKLRCSAQMKQVKINPTAYVYRSFEHLDLNLLRVFEALIEERSATRAGSRLGLTQSAISHALNRLRYVMKDELFVRGPDGMQPTERAAEIAPRLRQGLLQLQLALAPSEFAPERSD